MSQIAYPAQPVDYWLPIAVVMGGNALFYFFCYCKKDNSWIDVIWGLTFLTPIIALIISRASRDIPIVARIWIILGMTALWSFRLAWHIGARHTKEDFRYENMRKSWGENGACYL